MRDIRSNPYAIEPLEPRCLLTVGVFANVSPGGVYPEQIVALDDELVFIGQSSDGHRRLWASDGTGKGTHALSGVQPDPNGNLSFIRSGDYVYFSGDGGAGAGLWRTDGTASGTIFLAPFDLYNDNLGSLTDYDGILMFNVSGSLWRSDGTPQGTTLVSQAVNEIPWNIDMFSAGGWLYFDGTGRPGGGLWRSDGTPQGTAHYFNLPQIFGGEGVAVGDDLYVFDRTSDSLWKSDDALGMVKIHKFSYVSNLVEFGGSAWFISGLSGEPNGVWRASGTQLQKVYSGTGLNNLVVFGNRLLLTTTDSDFITQLLLVNPNTKAVTTIANLGSTTQVSLFPGEDRLAIAVQSTSPLIPSATSSLWTSDGTAAGTVKLTNVAFEPLGDPTFFPAAPTAAFLDGQFYFDARDITGDLELWASDLAPGGTHIVRDFVGEPVSIQFADLLPIGDTLYFTDHENRFSLGAIDRLFIWKTDGVHKPRLVSMFHDTDHAAASLFRAGNTLVVATNNTSGAGIELFVQNSKGKLVKIAGGNYHELKVIAQTADRTYFSMKGNHQPDNQLWVTDGTAKGTTMLCQSTGNPFDTRSVYERAVEFQGRLYFVTEGNTTSKGFVPAQLWSTDGTPAGTARVTSFAGRLTDPPYRIDDLCVSGNRIFLSTTIATGEGQLWASDGTRSGTAIIVNIAAHGLTAAGKVLYFWSNNIKGNAVLYKTDGTKKGTVRVKTFSSITTELRDLHAVGGTIYFTPFPTYNSPIYMSDGTEAGTVPTEWPTNVRTSYIGSSIFLTGDGPYISRGDHGHYTRVATLLGQYTASTLTLFADQYFFTLDLEDGRLWSYKP